MRNPADNISHVAYRVLGKFGGSNRKMLKESQRLQYVLTEVQGPSIKVEFTDCKAAIQLPMEKVTDLVSRTVRNCPANVGKQQRKNIVNTKPYSPINLNLAMFYWD